MWDNPFKNHVFPEEHTYGWFIGFADEHVDIANAVLYERRPEYDGIQGRKDLELVEALYESSMRAAEQLLQPLDQTAVDL